MEVLLSIVETLEIWNIEIHFSGLTSPVKDVVLRSGLARKLGGTHFHIGTHQAVIYLLNKWDRLEKQMKSEGEDAEVKTDRLKEYLGRVDRSALVRFSRLYSCTGPGRVTLYPALSPV